MNNKPDLNNKLTKGLKGKEAEVALEALIGGETSKTILLTDRSKEKTVRLSVDLPSSTHIALQRYLLDHPELGYTKMGPFLVYLTEKEIGLIK